MIQVCLVNMDVFIRQAAIEGRPPGGPRRSWWGIRRTSWYVYRNATALRSGNQDLVRHMARKDGPLRPRLRVALFQLLRARRLGLTRARSCPPRSSTDWSCARVLAAAWRSNATRFFF